MRSIVFEGDTWERYEAWRERDKQLHRNLCRILKEMQRDDPARGLEIREHQEVSLSHKRASFSGVQGFSLGPVYPRLKPWTPATGGRGFSRSGVQAL